MEKNMAYEFKNCAEAWDYFTDHFDLNQESQIIDNYCTLFGYKCSTIYFWNEQERYEFTEDVKHYAFCVWFESNLINFTDDEGDDKWAL